MSRADANERSAAHTVARSNGSVARRDVARVAATASAAAVAVGALGFGLCAVRSVVILLLLASTFAAAIRPGVEWLQRNRVPQPAAILSFFLGAVVVLFFWAAVPPAVHQIEQALSQHAGNGQSLREAPGIRHDVLAWLSRYLHQLPSGRDGHDVLHPVASYGRQATHGIVLLVTLVSFSVVSILFGGFAVVLAVPFTSAVATLIDVFVLDHDPPDKSARRMPRGRGAARLDPARSTEP
jgi:predicted PurR-regulated permease PerM